MQRWNGGGMPSFGVPAVTCALPEPSRGGGSRIGAPLVRAYRSLWGPLMVPTVSCLPGIRLLTALVVAHPRLGLTVGTEMALQLMSLAKGVLGPNLLKFASS